VPTTILLLYRVGAATARLSWSREPVRPLREAHEFLYGGSEEEQKLTRLSGVAAAAYLQPPPSGG